MTIGLGAGGARDYLRPEDPVVARERRRNSGLEPIDTQAPQPFTTRLFGDGDTPQISAPEGGGMSGHRGGQQHGGDGAFNFEEASAPASAPQRGVPLREIKATDSAFITGYTNDALRPDGTYLRTEYDGTQTAPRLHDTNAHTDRLFETPERGMAYSAESREYFAIAENVLKNLNHEVRRTLSAVSVGEITQRFAAQNRRGTFFADPIAALIHIAEVAKQCGYEFTDAPNKSGTQELRELQAKFNDSHPPRTGIGKFFCGQKPEIIALENAYVMFLGRAKA